MTSVEAPSEAANAGSTVADEMNESPAMKRPKSMPSAAIFQRRLRAAKSDMAVKDTCAGERGEPRPCFGSSN